jgi:hypothetical protein
VGAASSVGASSGGAATSVDSGEGGGASSANTPTGKINDRVRDKRTASETALNFLLLMVVSFLTIHKELMEAFLLMAFAKKS